MSDASPPNLPLEVSELADFIAAFNESTAKLKESHDRLRARAGQLAGELSLKNKELSERIEEVSALKNYLTNILSSITDGVMTINQKRQISALNLAASQLFPELSLVALDFEAVLSCPCRELAGLLNDTMEKEIACNRPELDVVCSDGILRSLSVSASPIRSDTGEVVGAVATFRDNTELRCLEQSLQRQERLAALGEMAAQLAHEIRNPLGGIELYASLLARALGEAPSEKELAQKIGKATSKLNRLVEDMLTFARPVKLQRQLVKPSYIFESALELAGSLLLEKKIRVERRYQSEEKFSLDADLLQRAFLNVILNAGQMMDQGGYLVVEVELVNAKHKYLQLSIADNGPGIPEKYREQVFNPFFSRRENGTGLGLAIVQKIVQDHQGTVVVAENQPQGAVFVFNIPV